MQKKHYFELVLLLNIWYYSRSRSPNRRRRRSHSRSPSPKYQPRRKSRSRSRSPVPRRRRSRSRSPNHRRRRRSRSASPSTRRGGRSSPDRRYIRLAEYKSDFRGLIFMLLALLKIMRKHALAEILICIHVLVVLYMCRSLMKRSL